MALIFIDILNIYLKRENIDLSIPFILYIEEKFEFEYFKKKKFEFEYIYDHEST